MKGKNGHLELLKKALNDSALSYRDGNNENHQLGKKILDFLLETKVSKEDSDFLTKAMIELNSSIIGPINNNFLSSLQNTTRFPNRSKDCQLLVMQEICMYFWKHNKKIEAYDYLSSQLNSLPYSNINFFNGLAGWMSFEYTKGIKSHLSKDRYFKRSLIHFNRYISLIKDDGYEPLFIESWLQLSYQMSNELPINQLNLLIISFPHDKQGLLMLLLTCADIERLPKERLTILLEIAICSLYLPFIPISQEIINEIEELLKRIKDSSTFENGWKCIKSGNLEGMMGEEGNIDFYFFNGILPISPE